ncbi:acetamidase/formamidase family protein [Hartmannibacter diazotrophicus]|nr:acetamidase/formamidase family protein [Hartmannibacter diazotrophicus]
MNIQQFISESYPEGAREEAWRDVLRIFALQSDLPPDGPGFFATAMLRGAADGVMVARLTAGPQSLSPIIARAELPLIVIPTEEGALLRLGANSQPVAPTEFMVLTRDEDWEVTFVRDVRVNVLSVSAGFFGGRKIRMTDFGGSRVAESRGLGAVLRQMAETAADTMKTLSDVDWAAVDQSLAELLLTYVSEPLLVGQESPGTATTAALLHRITRTIERRLDDPDLSAAKVSRLEGISERYLQKLFEGTGESFGHYLRERRLQRTRIELSNPQEAHLSVAEIAYRCGFTDAANFSRAFRERFGLSPRAFRQKQAEQLLEAAKVRDQRGWPGQALATWRGPLAPKGAGNDSRGPDNDAGRHPGESASGPMHHHLSVDASRVHWGYFSRSLKPLIEIASGDTITVETLTQHASDDPERMIVGDPGAESVFRWTRDGKGVERRGAGPIDASVLGRGAGEGFGVHICTGPIAVTGAEPGDVLEVRILDVAPRPSSNPDFAGRSFGSSVAAWWGYHYGELLGEPRPREVVTIYEIVNDADEPHAVALYDFLWEPQSDPFGTVHATYDYPGVPVAPGSVTRRYNVLEGVRIPLRPHFGVIAVAPKEAELVDSIPPSYFGGNLDNWRLGKGSAVYLPVAVPGALLSVGDSHASQGDGELAGTAIECSMTGTFKVILHKRQTLAEKPFADLSYPLIETETEWILTGFSHPNYLAEFGTKAQSEVYATSSLDLAMKDAFRKARRFLMSAHGLNEDEAIALISAAVDFGVTQVVDGNWGVHAIIRKSLLSGR